MGKMIPQPTTHTILNTHPRIHHIHTQKQPKPTDFICENKSPVIWKFRGLASFTKMTAVPAKISDNKVVLRNGKQIFLFQIRLLCFWKEIYPTYWVVIKTKLFYCASSRQRFEGYFKIYWNFIQYKAKLVQEYVGLVFNILVCLIRKLSCMLVSSLTSWFV